MHVVHLILFYIIMGTFVEEWIQAVSQHPVTEDIDQLERDARTHYLGLKMLLQSLQQSHNTRSVYLARVIWRQIVEM